MDNNSESGMKSLAKLSLDANLQIDVALAIFRKALYDEALRRTNNNQTKAARLLGVHRNTVVRFLSEKPRC